MKEIKFRAWVEHGNIKGLIKPYMNHRPEFQGDINEIFKNNGVEPKGLYAARITYMQFTGLPDSKRTEEYPEGQPIYDRDILRYYSDARMAVPTKDGGWKLEGNPHLEERTVVEYSESLGAYMVHGGSCYLHEIHDKSEVIGNTFENPELMEEWK